MRWTLKYSPEVVQKMYLIPREIWREAKYVVWALQDNPLPQTVQIFEDDPSIYWIALPGDYVLYYEILDEEHIVHLIELE